jgi:2OG-Fe(II) oxygenase superfamily
LTPEPSEVLRGEGWLRCARPFPHLVARNVFKLDFYRALERQIRGILAAGVSETPAPGRFSRNLPGYDAYALGLAPQPADPTGLFFSRPWRQLLAGIWGVSETPYVFVGAHHHSPGSRSGFIHNDFNPVWFPRSQGGRIQTPNQDLCSYKTGAGSLADDQKIEVVRGAALIFYLANDPWRPGDGGETGLYASSEAQIGQPATAWPPENNTLVSFECTPSSFHSFIANNRIARTSIIMWVHRPLQEAVARYGAERLERWKS